MKIAVVTTDSRVHYRTFGEPVPSFGTAPEGLFEGFRQLDGIEVHVISCSPQAMKSPAKIGANIWFHQPVVGPWGWGRSLFGGCAMAVRRLLREIGPDIVHGQGTERDCAIDAAFSGYPNVLTIHGNMRVHAARPEHAGMAYYKMAAILENLCLRKTDGVIAISTYTRDLVSDFTRRTWLVPNAVDPRFFDVRPSTPATPRILAVGTLNERKNPIGLLQACEPLLKERAITLAFAGSVNAGCTYSQRLQELAATLPGVEFLGFLSREQLAVEMARTTVLALPTFEDNCPMVVLEAMAASVPVAASRVGGVPDLVRHEVDGLLFDPSSPAEIESSIRRLVGDAGLCSRMGAAGRVKALKEYHPKAVAERHLQAYRGILDA